MFLERRAERLIYSVSIAACIEGESFGKVDGRRTTQ
jgi:hypothetical protein